MDEWLLECLENYNRLTPIQRLEFHEEIDRLTEDGKIIVIHGRKSEGRSILHVVDRFIWPKENTDHDQGADSAV